MKVWLVRVTVRDDFYSDEESVKKYDDEQSVLSFVGSVATGEFNQMTIKSIHSVDLGVTPPLVKSLSPSLDGFRLVLREV